MTHAKDNAKGSPAISRRALLGGALGVAAAGGAAALGGGWLKSLLGKNFRELTDQEVLALIDRVARENERKFGQPGQVIATEALPGVEFGYGLDLARCIGCRRCVYACVKENNQSRRPQLHWIRVLELNKEHGVDIFESNPYYQRKEVPDEEHFYMPVQCQQCRKPACTKSCPVGATWTEPDGITVIDQDWCIGCRCCMAACPYGARHFNWTDPWIPPTEFNPDIHLLGNRPRQRGVVEKCTFCIQRVRDDRYPACVEICPTGSRKFGNLLDPESEIRYIMKEKRVFIFKEAIGTDPRFFYFYA